MKLPGIRSFSKRFTIAFVACLCCLLWAGRGGAGSPARDRDAYGETGTERPFDDFKLVAQQFSPQSPQYDVNNFMLNPQWGWQVRHPVSPGAKPKRSNFPDSIDAERCTDALFSDCTGGQQAELDEPQFCVMCNLVRPKKNRKLGHVNWFTATYTGDVCFHNCSYPDMDYTFSLVPKGGAGLTRWNAPNKPGAGGEDDTPKAFHVEFDSRETVNRFRSDIWTKFGEKASPCSAKDVGIPGKNSCDPDCAKKMIEHRRAVVIGLLGLDSEHNIYSELHPVYAMAVEWNTDPNDNTWIIFARNTGNEGACSIRDHPLECPPGGGDTLSKLMLLIPPPAGATGVPEVMRTNKTQFYSNTSSCPEISYFVNPDTNYTEDNQGVLLTFNLDTCTGADCIPLIEGELHLKWSNVPATPAQEMSKCGPVAAGPSTGRHEDACIITESLLENESDKFDKPTAAQAASLLATLAQERNQFAAQMRKCPLLSSDAAITRGQPASSVCAVNAVAAAPPERRSRPTDRVSRSLEKIRKILEGKSK